jgi:hypothetical protein
MGGDAFGLMGFGDDPGKGMGMSPGGGDLWGAPPLLQFEQNRAIAERAHNQVNDFANKVNEATINGGNLALRMVLLINGGAAVALLSFMNALPKDQRQAIASALAWFAWGVAAAALALGLAYFTHRCVVGIQRSKKLQYEAPYVTDGPRTAMWARFYWAFHTTAVLAGIGSLVLFVVGMLSIKSAFINL